MDVADRFWATPFDIDANIDKHRRVWGCDVPDKLSSSNSVGRGSETRCFGQSLTGRSTPRGIAAAEGGHMITGHGAVPILRNGIIEGACGVGEGTAQQDEDCAQAVSLSVGGGMQDELPQSPPRWLNRHALSP